MGTLNIRIIGKDKDIASFIKLLKKQKKEKLNVISKSRLYSTRNSQEHRIYLRLHINFKPDPDSCYNPHIPDD